jgi:uncharacterized protein YbjT (DUF2867 family)
LNSDSSALTAHISTDNGTWATTLKNITPAPSIFFSALGTTRGAAGSISAQRAIDFDLNLALARAAKEAGVNTCVLISVAAVSSSSPFPYSKMKADLEEEVKMLGFKHTVLIKPGLIAGAREDSRPAEAVLRGIAKGLGAISKGWLTDWWAQDADVIAKAAVSAALECVSGGAEGHHKIRPD